MATQSKKIFLFLGILTGVVSACLGLELSHDNHLGWALLFAGTAFITIGCISLGALDLSKEREAEKSDRSLWLGAAAALLLSLVTPLEYLLAPPILPRSDHAQDIGLILFAGGLAFYLLSLQPSRPSAGGKPNWHAGWPVIASVLLFGLGLGIGFSSLAGLLVLALFLLPVMVRRVNRVNAIRS